MLLFNAETSDRMELKSAAREQKAEPVHHDVEADDETSLSVEEVVIKPDKCVKPAPTLSNIDDE